MKIYKYLDEKCALNAIKSNTIMLSIPENFDDPLDCLMNIKNNDFKKVNRFMEKVILFHSLYNFVVESRVKIQLWIKNLFMLQMKLIKKYKQYKFPIVFSLLIRILYKKIKINDPILFKNINKEKEKFKKEALKYIEIIKKNFFISCFSEKQNINYMWEKYGGENKGVCIEYEIDDEIDIKTVRYKAKNARFPLFYLIKKIAPYALLDVEIDINEFKNNKVIDCFLVKTKKWKKEREKRIIFHQNQFSDRMIPFSSSGRFLYKMPVKIKRIFLGNRIDDELANSIVEYALINDIDVLKTFKNSKSKICFTNYEYNSTNPIIKRLNNFLENENKHALLLSGSWGVGKTYLIDLWKKINQSNCNIKFISLSLFGISNVRDLNALALNEESMRNRLISGIKELNQDVGVGVGVINISLPLMGIVSSFLKQSHESKKQKYVFIIDDIERKDNKLSIAEILGFVDQLPKENTKVVLIANVLNFFGKDQNEFKNFYEKIIDEQIFIDAPEIQTYKNILGDNIFDKIKHLVGNCKNLRTIIKFKEIIDIISCDEKELISCIFICLQHDLENKYGIDDLKELYNRENREFLEALKYMGERNIDLSKRYEDTEKYLLDISVDENKVLCENIKKRYLLTKIADGELYRCIFKIRECLLRADYCELSKIVISVEKSLNIYNVDARTLALTNDPNTVYLEHLHDINKNIINDSFDSLSVFKEYIKLKFYSRQYIEEDKNIVEIESQIEENHIQLLANRIIEVKIDHSIEGINSFFNNFDIPNWLLKIEEKIYFLCLRKIEEKHLSHIEMKSINLEKISNDYLSISKHFEKCSFIKTVSLDNIYMKLVDAIIYFNENINEENYGKIIKIIDWVVRNELNADINLFKKMLNQYYDNETHKIKKQRIGQILMSKKI